MRCLALIAVLSVTFIVAETLILYEGYDKSGKLLRVYSSSTPDLTDSLSKFNNKAMSICGSGIWILYKYINYITVPDLKESFGEVVLLDDSSSKPACKNLQIAPGKVSSLRSIDWNKYNRPERLILFELAHFGGSMTTFTGNSSSIAGFQASLIITGTARWTITVNRFTSFCLIPAVEDIFQVAAIEDFTAEPYDIPLGSIQSVQLGCSGKERALVVIGEGKREIRKKSVTISGA